MKLSTNQIEQIHKKLRIHLLPDDYAALANLREVFGDQTFYMTADGLHIWEYAEVAGTEGQVIIALKVAAWANEKKSDLSLHKPQLTDVTVQLEDVPATKAVNG